jgi:hypothetical protein
MQKVCKQEGRNTTPKKESFAPSLSLPCSGKNHPYMLSFLLPACTVRTYTHYKPSYCTQVTLGPKRGRWEPALLLSGLYTRINTQADAMPCTAHHPIHRSGSRMPKIPKDTKCPVVDLAWYGLVGG